MLSAKGLDGQDRKNVGGYAMAALLVAIGVMAVMLTVAMPAWRQLVQREKEEELIFRGQQYVRAIGLFQRNFGVTYPPNIDVLVEKRFLRRKYKDPMTEDGEFQLLYQGRLAATQRAGQGPQAGPLASRGQGPGTGSPLGGSLPGSGSTPFAQQTGRGGMGTGPGTGSGAGQGIRAGGPLGAGGGIIGVASKSTAKSIRLYNGRNYYNEWEFIWLAASARPGVGPQQLQVPGQMRPPGQQRGPFGGPGQGPRGFGPRGQPIGPGGGPTGPRNPGGGPGN
jgi:type II secretory pathway pseudopilin PulG